MASGLAILGPARARAEDADHAMHMFMAGMYGPYSMTREASGTSWQPESTPHQGPHAMVGDWMAMAHGFIDGVYDRQSGPRGGAKVFSESMLMAMGQRPLWGGTFGLRGMWSLDPTMGPNGYPLLLQTGETGDGTNPLIDRQHPHNFFMEMAAAYSYPLADDGSVFGYAGLPGEPALGPATFMHRFSAMDNPEAPITHHWLDSTHVTEGVVTLGYVRQDWKFEGSSFHGREPDQDRWAVEPGPLDSFSARLSYNPTEDWALQASYGHIVSPEQLTPDVSQGRLTASASGNWRWGDNPAQTTFAWGRLYDHPGRTLDGFLLESAIRIRKTQTAFGRAERVAKDELFETGPLAGRAIAVNKISLGYLYDFGRWRRSRWGVGGVGSVYPLPAALRTAYGPTPGSFLLFVRATLL